MNLMKPRHFSIVEKFYAVTGTGYHLLCERTRQLFLLEMFVMETANVERVYCLFWTVFTSGHLYCD